MRTHRSRGSNRWPSTRWDIRRDSKWKQSNGDVVEWESSWSSWTCTWLYTFFVIPVISVSHHGTRGNKWYHPASSQLEAQNNSHNAHCLSLSWIATMWCYASTVNASHRWPSHRLYLPFTRLRIAETTGGPSSASELIHIRSHKYLIEPDNQ